MASLYELSGSYKWLLDELEAAESDEEREAIYERLEQLDADIVDKAENYARIIQCKRAEAEGYAREKERLNRRQKAAEATADRLQKNLLQAMQALQIGAINTGIGVWKVAKNPWSCEVIDEREVPEEYRIPLEIPYKVNKDAIKKHFRETGELIPGVEVRQSVGLRFK